MTRLPIVTALIYLLTTGAVAAQTGACQPSASGEIPLAIPQEVGMRSAGLAEAIGMLRENDRDIHALLIMRNCRIVVEHYAENVTRDHNHDIYSVTKSIVATLVGTLLRSGRLASLDVPVADVIGADTALSPDMIEKARRITVRHVMSMASGLEYFDKPSGHPIYRSADRLHLALTPPIVNEPGKRYNYSNGDATLAGAAVAAAAGSDLLDYADKVLFQPLGFKNVEWSFRDDAGRYPGGWGLRLRTIDMAKLGQLYLQNGRWQGKAVVDPSFVKAAWTPSRAAAHYGLFWWISTKTFKGAGPVYFANGFKGQRVYIVPKYGIVIAVNANVSAGDERDAYNAFVRRVIAAAQNDGSTKGSPGEGEQLAAAINAPFKGKPGGPAWEQDVPRLPRPK